MEAESQFKKISLWGDGQITDDFFDGHGRGEDFLVEGHWMRRTLGGTADKADRADRAGVWSDNVTGGNKRQRTDQ